MAVVSAANPSGNSASPAFFWGRNGEKLTAKQVQQQREMAQALFGMNNSVAETPWEGIAQLSRAWAGSEWQRRADEGYAAGREGIAELVAGLGPGSDPADISGILTNDFATENERAIAQLLFADQLEQADPLYQLKLQAAQAELDALNRPTVAEPIEVGGVLVDPVTYQPLFDSRTPDNGSSAREEQIARMMETGVDRVTAINLVDGRWVRETNPITGEFTIYDMANGQPVFGQDQPSPTQPGANISQANPEVVQQFGPQFPASNEAFGVTGAAQGAINTFGDAIGIGAPYPEVQQTQADFGLLRESLLNDIASSYGRQPPSWLLQEIRNLTPAAGSAFEGAGQAVSKLNALGRHLQSELEMTQQSLQRQLSPENRQELEARAQGLQAGLARVTGAIRSFEQVPPDGAQAPEGVDPELWSVMTSEERALWQ